MQKVANEIQMICGNTDTYQDDAWSKRQLMEMISDIQIKCDRLLELTGVVDIEAHYTRILEQIDPHNLGEANRFVPFSDT